MDAPPQTVFNYLANGTRTPEWYEAVRSAIKTSEGSTGKGTRFRFTRVLPQGEVVNEVEISEFREPDLVTFASRSGPTPFVYRYRVEPTTAGSKVILEGSITGEGLTGSAALLAPFAGKFFARGMSEKDVEDAAGELAPTATPSGANPTVRLHHRPYPPR